MYTVHHYDGDVKSRVSVKWQKWSPTLNYMCMSSHVKEMWKEPVVGTYDPIPSLSLQKFPFLAAQPLALPKGAILIIVLFVLMYLEGNRKQWPLEWILHKRYKRQRINVRYPPIKEWPACMRSYFHFDIQSLRNFVLLIPPSEPILVQMGTNWVSLAYLDIA